MRKALLTCFIILLCFLSVLGWNLKKELHSEDDISPISKIGEAVCAKFECNGNSMDEIFITSEIKTLSNVFSSLDIEKVDKTVSEWVYRITFNCTELYPDAQEIVVLIGNDAMLINGESYSTPETVPFKSVVDIFDSKYKFFSESVS